MSFASDGKRPLSLLPKIVSMVASLIGSLCMGYGLQEPPYFSKSAK